MKDSTTGLINSGGKLRLRMLVLISICVLAASGIVHGQNGKLSHEEIALKNLQWRAIGPANMGGRIDDFAVVESNPAIFYVGAATGGLWKTTNAGTTFDPVFDGQGSTSIGDVCIAPSDPNVVWVGTGEPNNRQSSSWGDGVYRSLDGGATWQNMGLRDSKHIGRVVIDPRDPNIVLAGTYDNSSAGPQRGVFKTIDGGKTWNKALFKDDKTGISDMCAAPDDVRIIYAASYTFQFDPNNRGGIGSESQIFQIDRRRHDLAATQ